ERPPVPSPQAPVPVADEPMGIADVAAEAVHAAVMAPLEPAAAPVAETEVSPPAAETQIASQVTEPAPVPAPMPAKTEIAAPATGSRVSDIEIVDLTIFNVRRGRPLSPEGLKLRTWGVKHANQTLPLTLVEVVKMHGGINRTSVYRVLDDNHITLKNRNPKGA